MKSFRQSDFYHTWFKPCKGGRLQAGGEAKRNPCYKCDDEFHSAKGTTENTGNLFCRPYRLCFICVYQMQGLRTSFVKLVINLTIFFHHNSFFNSSISGNAFCNLSGISDKVSKVATPIGLS